MIVRKLFTLLLFLLFLGSSQAKLITIYFNNYTFSLSVPDGKELSQLYTLSDQTLLFHETVILYFNNTNSVNGLAGLMIVFNWLTQYASSSSTNSALHEYEGVADSNGLSPSNIYPEFSSNSFLTQTYISAGTHIDVNVSSHDDHETVVDEAAETDVVLVSTAECQPLIGTTCTASSTDSYKCLLGCNIPPFKNRPARGRHVKKVHSEKWNTILSRLPFTCPFCKTVIFTADQLGRHRRIHGLTGYDDFFRQ